MVYKLSEKVFSLKHNKAGYIVMIINKGQSYMVDLKRETYVAIWGKDERYHKANEIKKLTTLK